MEFHGLFEKKAEVYHKTRPGYAPQALELLCSLVPTGSTVADVGAGTGIFSNQLLDSGFKVKAIEPNPGMRTVAEREFSGRSGFELLGGSAEATGLSDASVHAVTAGQAFHWFDLEPTKAEWKRILKPGGPVFLVWNSSPWSRSDELEKIQDLMIRLKDTRGKAPLQCEYRPDRLAAFFEPRAYEMREFEHDFLISREGFFGLAESRSYFPHEGDEGFEEVHKELTELLEEVSDPIQVVITTTVCFGRLN